MARLLSLTGLMSGFYACLETGLAGFVFFLFLCVVFIFPFFCLGLTIHHSVSAFFFLRAEQKIALFRTLLLFRWAESLPIPNHFILAYPML